ncbi:hypothetical protein AXK11_09020 [Cephaloticoccus primus]|uniref:NADP-dependent oxidoreductase domain-containing protein n=1 Tax=Cephaloticoccus primus TaxID=1548207 RepID=A0A139SHK5_9BACT|nr:hypothetical protein AXK11_09020 [Cephaloticoccus primus]
MTQKTVTLPDGSRVPALGMGSWQLASGRHPRAQVEEALRVGLSLGLRLIDTAENYSGGASEQLVGSVIADQREQVFVVTKVQPSNARSEQSIRRSCERSLRNLGTDYIDLYLLHWRAGEHLPTVVDTFEALKAEGRIRHWGVSNFYVRGMEELYAIPGGKNCAANQVRYSLSDRSIEALGLVDWAAQHGLPLMAYSPLGSGGGLLSNPVLGEVAARHGVSAAAVALAWTMRSGSVVSIPESGRVAHTRENARAAGLTLDADDLAKLDRAFPARHIPHWSDERA